MLLIKFKTRANITGKKLHELLIYSTANVFMFIPQNYFFLIKTIISKKF